MWALINKEGEIIKKDINSIPTGCAVLCIFDKKDQYTITALSNENMIKGKNVRLVKVKRVILERGEKT